jgi:CRP-like cAMP-binding protein
MADRAFLPLNPLDLSRNLGSQLTTQDYRSGEPIFAQGDKANAVFFIQRGNVKLTVVSSGGRKAVTSILRQGDLFGEGCLTRQSFRMSTATAIQLSTITRLKRATIARVLRQDPAFAKLFIAHLLLRIERVEEEFVDQVCNSSEKRLARILLVLSGFGVQPESEQNLPKVNQETLAEMVGTTRSRVSFFMNRFRDMGFIDYNGGLHVHQALQTFLLEK